MLNYFSKKSGQKEFIYLARNTDRAKVTGEKKVKIQTQEFSAMIESLLSRVLQPPYLIWVI